MLNICRLKKINDSLQESNLHFFDDIANYEELILAINTYNSNNLLRFIKLVPYYKDDTSIYDLFNLATSNNYGYYRYYINSYNFLTDDIIRNVIKLLKKGFNLEKAVQCSFVSIPRTEDEVKELIREYKDAKLDYNNIYRSTDEDSKVNQENQIELQKLLESNFINQESFNNLSNKKVNYYFKNKIQYTSRDFLLNDEIIKHFILLHNLRDISTSNKLNLSYKIIARTDEEIESIIKIYDLGIIKNYEIFQALKHINIDNFIELKKLGIENDFAILSSNCKNQI